MRNLSIAVLLSIFVVAACEKEYVTNVKVSSCCESTRCNIACPACITDTVWAVDTIYVDTVGKCNYHDCKQACDPEDKECRQRCKEECRNGHHGSHGD